jgi:ABC-2 type transport system ATP-binding protein
MSLAIEILGLTKDYSTGFWRKRPKRVLHGLDLQVEMGEVFGLLGPNGAGKTTTLKILMRLIFPTAGKARLLGKPFDDFRAHAQVGYLPETPSFYDHLTAEEFLKYSAALVGLPDGEGQRRAWNLLERVGLKEAWDVPLRKFSKGMVQRLGVAQALINDPQLVILDEPMSGLDPLGRREARDLILELRERGKTVLFSTHILSDAETLCDRVAILNQGRLLGCGELVEILRMGVAATELLLETPSPALLHELSVHTRSIVRTGERVRIVLPEETDITAVLDLAARHAAKIVSLNPVKVSLEDYFMARVRDSSPAQVDQRQLQRSKGDRQKR